MTAAIALALAGCAHRPGAVGGAAGEEAGPVAASGDVQAGLERSRAVLLEGAADLSIEARRRALALLVRFDAAPGGGTWGPRALGDPSRHVQRASVEALAERLAEPESRALLMGLSQRTGAEPTVRCAAALRLVRFAPTAASTAAAADAARALWREETGSGRLAPCALVGAVAGDAEAQGALDRALRSGDLPLDLDFLADLGDAGLVALVPALVAALDTSDDALRLPLAATLIRLGAPEGRAPFVAAIAPRHGPMPAGGDPDALDADLVRLEVVDLLLGIDSPDAAALLREVAQRGDAAGISARAALAAVGHGDAGDVLAGLESDDPDVRAVAARCAGIVVGLTGRRARLQRAALLELATGSTSRDAERIAAFRALASAGTPDLLKPLRAALERGSTEVRVEAAGAVLAIERRVEESVEDGR